MIDPSDRLALGVRAVRSLTDAPADGRASRAEVLVRVARRAQRRRGLRIAGLIVLSGLLVSSARAGFLHAWKTWGGHQAAKTPPSPSGGPGHAAGPRPTPTVPPAVQVREREALSAPPRVPERHAAAAAQAAERVSSRPAQSSPELALYEKAHRLHFHEGPSDGALRLWDAYIAQFPRGRFSPEARFNRAVCLIRLADLARARTALEEVVSEHPSSFQAEQATHLLAKLGRP